jgi:hypothetical protein
MSNISNCITVKNDYIYIDEVLNSSEMANLELKLNALAIDLTKFKTYANSKFFEYLPCVFNGESCVVLSYKKKKYLLPNKCTDYNAFVLYVDTLAAKLSTTLKDSTIPKTESKLIIDT